MSPSSKTSKDQTNSTAIDAGKFRNIVENAREGILVMQGEKRVYYNARWLEITGYSAEGYEDVGFLSLIHPDDLELVTKNYQKVIAHEAFDSVMEFRLVTRSGEVKHLDIKVSRIDWDGQPAALVLASDITVEQEAFQKITFQANLLNAMQQSVIATDLAGVITYWNPFAEQLYGWSADEVLGKNVVNVTVPEISQAQGAAIMEKLGAGESWAGEFTAQRKDGSKFPAYVVDIPILGVEGELTGIIGISEDISNRKRVEEALLENQARYKKAQAIGKVGNWEYNPVTDMLWGSDEAKRILGLDAGNETFTIENVESCIPERERVHQALIDLLEEDKKYNLVFDITTYDEGILKTIKSIAEVERNSKGEPIKVTGVITDITEQKETEKALKESEEKYSVLSNNMNTGLVLHGADTRILFSNPRASEILGLSTEQMQGKEAIDPVWKFVNEDKSNMALEDYPVNRIISTEKALDSYILGIIKPDKEAVSWVSVNGMPVFDEENNLSYVSITFQDITEQKRAEEKVAESQERFDLAMKASKDGLFDWNLETNEIYYSPGWKSMLGYEYDELPNDFSVWETHTEPKDVERSWQMQQEMIEKKRERFEIEFKMKHKNGHWVDILSRAEAVFNKKGKAIRIVGTHVDITDRKRARHKLQQSESKYRNLVETASDAIYLMNAEGYIIDTNQSACSALGRARDEIVGQPIDFIDPNYPVAEFLAFWQDVPFDKQIIFESTHRHKDGSLIPVELSAQKYTLGDVVYYYGIARDIASRKEAEKELKKHREELEKLVEQRTAELEAKVKEHSALFDMMIGREVRMAELKKVITSLREQLKRHGIKPLANDPLLQDDAEY